MRAISIKQPWAWAILHAGKGVENRTWSASCQAKLPTRLAIHAGKTEDVEGRLYLESRGIAVPANLPKRCLVGEVTVTACQYTESPDDAADRFGPWAFGPWCWLLTDAQAYDEPIPCKGRLGIFEVTPDD